MTVQDISSRNKTDEAYRPSEPLDPLAAQIAQAFSAAPLTAYPIEVTRKAIRDACVLSGMPVMAEVSDHLVPVSGGDEIALRIYRPSSQQSKILIWAHGGGFALGSIDEIDNFARLLAARTGCAVASVDYRLAPEHKFPTAVEDLEAAVLWLAARRQELGFSEARLWLGGDSAGGNLATVVTRRLHTAGSAAIAGNILAYPCTDSPLAESLRQFQPPFMTADEVAWFTELYLPGPEAREHPDFAPLHATGLDRLPRTLIVTAGHDILTAQAERYGVRLEERGVETKICRFPGMIHGFLTLDPFLPGAAGEAIDLIDGFMRERPHSFGKQKI